MAPRSKKGVQKGGMSTAYSTSSINKDKVFYALATATTIGHRQRCKFWKSFLQKVAFIQKTMPVIAHRSSRTLWVPFRRRSQLLPVTRGNMLHLFTHYRGALFSHKGSSAYCPSGILTSHFRGVKSGLRFQTIRHSCPHTMCPPNTA